MPVWRPVVWRALRRLRRGYQVAWPRWSFAARPAQVRVLRCPQESGRAVPAGGQTCHCGGFCRGPGSLIWSPRQWTRKRKPTGSLERVGTPTRMEDDARAEDACRLED